MTALFNVDKRLYFMNQASWAMQQLMIDIISDQLDSKKTYKMQLAWGHLKQYEFKPKPEVLKIFSVSDFTDNIQMIPSSQYKTQGLKNIFLESL